MPTRSLFCPLQLLIEFLFQKAYQWSHKNCPPNLQFGLVPTLPKLVHPHISTAAPFRLTVIEIYGRRQHKIRSPTHQRDLKSDVTACMSLKTEANGEPPSLYQSSLLPLSTKPILVAFVVTWLSWPEAAAKRGTFSSNVRALSKREQFLLWTGFDDDLIEVLLLNQRSFVVC